MGLSSMLGKAAAGLGVTAAGAAATGAEPVAAGAGLLAGGAKVAQWAMLLGPLIADFFSGSGSDDEAAKKIADARDGLAARLSAAEHIPLDQATKAVNDQLAPLIQQHAQDAGGKAGRVVNDALSAAGGFALGRGMGAAGRLAKGAATVAEDAGPLARGAEAVAESGGPSAMQKAALDSLAEHGRLDAAVMESKRQGLPVISGKQGQALGGLVDENRMTRQFDPTDEWGGGTAGPSRVPSPMQGDAADSIGLTQQMQNEVADPGVGDAQVERFLDHFRTQEALRRLMQQKGLPGGFRTPGGLPG